MAAANLFAQARITQILPTPIVLFARNVLQIVSNVPNLLITVLLAKPIFTYETIRV